MAELRAQAVSKLLTGGPHVEMWRDRVTQKYQLMRSRLGHFELALQVSFLCFQDVFVLSEFPEETLLLSSLVPLWPTNIIFSCQSWTHLPCKAVVTYLMGCAYQR